LQSFPDLRQPPAEIFGAALSDPSIRRVGLYTSAEHAEAAECYMRVNNLRSKAHLEVMDVLPSLADIGDPGVVPLFMDSAINPTLNDRFFRNPDRVSFVDHQYVPHATHASPEIKTIGTTAHGLAAVNAVHVGSNLPWLQRCRAKALKAVCGAAMHSPMDMRSTLHSSGVEKIRIHALGPKGTNIQQVADQYVQLHGIGAKAEVIVHERGVEPMEYAEIAAKERMEGVLPLHIECAVYYHMAALYRKRANELVFADHHEMKLDTMQLAAQSSLPESRPLRLASHPSPVGLVHRWIESGDAVHIKASSNADAAAKVAEGGADCCITTESARRAHALQQLHSFGAPTMLFTLGTPCDTVDLERLRT
jgi:hypothetical protein